MVANRVCITVPLFVALTARTAIETCVHSVPALST